MEDPVLSDKFSRDIMEDYFGVPLNTKIEVLQGINNDEIKFEVEKYRNEIHVEFDGIESITSSNMNFSLLYTP